jgi:hypothetical protein
LDEFTDFFVVNVPNPPHNIDIKKFIEQFVIYGGHPRYVVNSDISRDNNSFLVNMNLTQTQEKNETVIDDFLMYIKVDFLDTDNNLIKSKYIINDSQEQNYNFILEKEPKKIILDTTMSLLEIMENNITSIFDYADNVINIFPNPTFSNNEITIISNECLESIVVTDLQGNIIANNLQISTYTDNKYSLILPKLSSGAYFILVNKNNIYKLIVNE